MAKRKPTQKNAVAPKPMPTPESPIATNVEVEEVNLTVEPKMTDDEFEEKRKQFERIVKGRFMTEKDADKLAREIFEDCFIAADQLNQNQIAFEIEGIRVPKEGYLTINRK